MPWVNAPVAASFGGKAIHLPPQSPPLVLPDPLGVLDEWPGHKEGESYLDVAGRKWMDQWLGSVGYNYPNILGCLRTQYTWMSPEVSN